jgi:hypothetical protein
MPTCLFAGTPAIIAWHANSRGTPHPVVGIQHPNTVKLKSRG